MSILCGRYSAGSEFAIRKSRIAMQHSYLEAAPIEAARQRRPGVSRWARRGSGLVEDEPEQHCGAEVTSHACPSATHRGSGTDARPIRFEAECVIHYVTLPNNSAAVTSSQARR
jgi:hypothetical protein